MKKERNVSWHWEIDKFPDVTFRTIEKAKQYILDHGEFETAYVTTKVTDETNRRNPNKRFSRTLTKINKHMVCSICNCIRRTVVDIVEVKSNTRLGLAARVYADSVVWLGSDKTCSNPACKDYREYLKKTHSADILGFSHCKEDGCRRTSVKGYSCEIHGGPPIDSPKHKTFEDFAQDAMYRTSEHEILEKLRFLDEDCRWVVRDRGVPVSEYFRTIEDWSQRNWNDAELDYYHSLEDKTTGGQNAAEAVLESAHEDAIAAGKYDDED